MLSGFDLVISAIDAGSQLAQITLATAAKEARVARFIPCGFTTVCPPGDVMLIRDDVRSTIPVLNLVVLHYHGLTKLYHTERKGLSTLKEPFSAIYRH